MARGLCIFRWRDAGDPRAAAAPVPRRQPTSGIGYGALLASMLQLLATSRPLQRRAAYQGALFAVFNLFWTGAPLMLHDRFGFSQDGIALFALAGAGGVLSRRLSGAWPIAAMSVR